MKPVQSLPEGYLEVGTLDLAKNKHALLLVSLLGLVLMCVFGVFFIYLISVMRPIAYNGGEFAKPFGLGSVLFQTISLLIMLVIMLLLHEGIHGVFFWVFSRTRPKFAFKGLYAYAGLPGWYIPRGKYLVTALAPFFLITLIGVLLLAVLPSTWFIPLLGVLVSNAAGSVGDLVVAVWLIFQPRGSLAQDRGDAVTIYKPATIL